MVKQVTPHSKFLEGFTFRECLEAIAFVLSVVTLGVFIYVY